jgi:hypothetical protein
MPGRGEIHHRTEEQKREKYGAFPAALPKNFQIKKETKKNRIPNPPTKTLPKAKKKKKKKKKQTSCGPQSSLAHFKPTCSLKICIISALNPGPPAGAVLTTSAVSQPKARHPIAPGGA